MRFPFNIVFVPPTSADLRTALRDARVWTLVLALGLLAGVAITIVRVRQSAPATTAGASLQVSSEPPGATILIDGREPGRTPSMLALPSGPHRVTLHLARYANVAYDVVLAPDRPATLDGLLWPQTPAVQRLRSPLPGATIADARFLADGRTDPIGSGDGEGRGTVPSPGGKQ